MKKLLSVLLAVIMAECFGQQARPLLGGLCRPGQQSWNEKQFLEKHPTGTNEFNRTFPQQQDYEKGFDLKSFLGYEFGGTYTNGVAYSCGDNAYKECLVKPFRMFQEVILRHTELGHLYEVELRTNTINIASTSLSNEIERIKAILSKTYQIDLKDNKRRHRPSADCSFDFTDSPGFHFDMYCSCDRTTGNGQMRLTATSRRIYNLDESKVREKKEREVAARSTTIEIDEDVGADLLTATAIVDPKRAKERKNGHDTSQGGGILGGSLRARRLQRQQDAEKLAILKDPSSYEKSAKERVAKAEERVTRLNSIKEKSVVLSADAKKLYDADVVAATNELACAVVELKKIEDVLTPQARAEFARRQKEEEEIEKRRLGAQREYLELLKGTGLESEAVERVRREAERAERRQQLLAIQEELKRVREAKARAKGEE